MLMIFLTRHKHKTDKWGACVPGATFEIFFEIGRG